MSEEDIQIMQSQQEPIKYSDQRLLEELLALEPENLIASRMWKELAAQFQPKLTTEQRIVILVLRNQASRKKAKEILLNSDVRAHLCAALLQGSDDIFEVSKIVTPVLLGLVTTGTISIPLTPVLFASIALHIARMSIASLCVDYDKADDKK